MPTISQFAKKAEPHLLLYDVHGEHFRCHHQFENKNRRGKERDEAKKEEEKGSLDPTVFSSGTDSRYTTRLLGDMAAAARPSGNGPFMHDEDVKQALEAESPLGQARRRGSTSMPEETEASSFDHGSCRVCSQGEAHRTSTKAPTNRSEISTCCFVSRRFGPASILPFSLIGNKNAPPPHIFLGRERSLCPAW